MDRFRGGKRNPCVSRIDKERMESGITIRQKEKTLQECKIKQGKCHMLRWRDISSFFIIDTVKKKS